jgi:hypothetical protein
VAVGSDTVAAGSSDAGKAAEHAAGSRTSPENELVLQNVAGSAGGGAAELAGISGQVRSAWYSTCWAEHTRTSDLQCQAAQAHLVGCAYAADALCRLCRRLAAASHSQTRVMRHLRDADADKQFPHSTAGRLQLSHVARRCSQTAGRKHVGSQT